MTELKIDILRCPKTGRHALSVNGTKFTTSRATKVWGVVETVTVDNRGGDELLAAMVDAFGKLREDSDGGVDDGCGPRDDGHTPPSVATGD